MLRPARFSLGAAGGGGALVGIKLIEFAINHGGAVGSCGTGPRVPKAEALHLNAPGDLRNHPSAQLGHQQQKPDRIGEKPRRQQKGTGKKDQRAMRQRRQRIAHCAVRSAQGLQHLKPLLPHQQGADDPGQQHNSQRWPQRQPAANLDEQTDFNQRNRHECQQKPHAPTPGIIDFGGGAVDLAPPLTYIGKQRQGR